ncbi:hypothetical protein [Streptomyces mirabilis]|uniref:hypothetical protein n=1 Tax=Streptomyces mirabilis TaxID=68239 RepID=UPI0033AC978C
MAGLTSVVNRRCTAHACLHTTHVCGIARRVTTVNRGFATCPAPPPPGRLVEQLIDEEK